jgi:hypothetical protein
MTDQVLGGVPGSRAGTGVQRSDAEKGVWKRFGCKNEYRETNTGQVSAKARLE